MSSPEVCQMETSDEDHQHHESDGLSSDLGGFLSTTCMETDDKSDPFSSDSTLNFPVDSSRFDSECILTSSLSESASVQQTTTCDSIVPSYVSGEGETLPCPSVLSGGSLLLSDVESSTTQKLTNLNTQFTQPNFLLMNEADACGSTSDQKVDFASPFHLLTPISQPHPVVLGNSSAANFVKNVLQVRGVAGLPISSSSPSSSSYPISSTANTFPSATKNAVSLPPGVVFLNPALLPHVSFVQTSEMHTAPLMIQLPSSAVSDMGQLPLLLLDSQNGHSVVGNTPTAVSDCADTDHPPVIHTSCPSSAPSHFVPLSTPVSVSSPASSPLVVHTPSPGHSFAGTRPDITWVSANTSAVAPDPSVPVLSSSFQDCQTSKGRPMVISNVLPDAANSKGLQQVLQHFLQQNREVRESMALTNMKCDMQMDGSSSPIIENSADIDSHLNTNEDINMPHIVSVKNISDISDLSSLKVPSLGERGNSVVLILRRHVAQAGVENSVTEASSGNFSKTSATATSSQSCSVDSKISSSLTNTSPLMSGNDIGETNLEGEEDDDEIDGSVAAATNSALPFLVSSTDTNTLFTAPSTVQEHAGNITNISQENTQPALVSDPCGQATVQWLQTVKFSDNNNIADSDSREDEDKDEEEEEGARDLQKLIPVTVSEKLVSDACRPIILCIVQEDGVRRQVNINPVESDRSWGSNVQCPGGGGGGGGSASGEQGDASPHKTAGLQEAYITEGTDVAGHAQPAAAPHSPGGHSRETSPEPAVYHYQGAVKAGTSGKQKFQCDLCTAVFTRYGNFTRHRKIHTVNLKEDKQFKCPFCERPFLQRCDMRRHLAIHTNEHPFHCATCGKGYIRKSDLVVHERFHSKDRAFKCDICERCFYQSGDLRRHKRLLHCEQSQLTWQCAHCDRKYAGEVTLIRHMKTKHNDILLQSALTAETPVNMAADA